MKYDARDRTSEQVIGLLLTDGKLAPYIAGTYRRSLGEAKAIVNRLSAMWERKPFTGPEEISRVLRDAAWEGKWNPNDDLNIKPQADHTARVLWEAIGGR